VSSRFGPSDGLVPQAIDDMRLGCVQTNRRLQEDVQPYGSGIDGTLSSMTDSGGFTPGTPVSTHKIEMKKMKRWWFSPGFSGFHPLKRIEKEIKRERNNFILFLILLFYSNANKKF